MNIFTISSKNKLSFSLIVLIFFLIPFQVVAQLTVNSGLTATQLAQLLAGPNITISNASITGSGLASGSFNGVNSNLGMNSGVILSTGNINNSSGPNNSTGGGDNLNSPGTAQMTALAGATSYDAITLKFDFSIQSDFVQFQYIFASEEYPEYAPPNNSSYNDVFAFYISGPGITGEENIALIPGTSNPVSINNINAVTNNQFYINNAGGTTVQYDAWTTVLTAKRTNLTPCQTYTMKLVIADAGDKVWNSAVFLLENSFIQGVVAAQTNTVNGDNIALEGCIPASIEFSLDVPSLTNTTIHYQIGGSATNGVDYSLIDTSVTIPAGQLSASIIINSIADGIPEGQESIYIIYKPDICSPLDTAFLYINDAQPIEFTLNETNLTCFENSTGEILINASGGFPPYTYEITEPQGAVTNYSTNPITGLAAGTYTVQVYDIYGCKAVALVVGGVYDADTTFLPDGSGVTYTTQIPIAGFGNGETIDSLSQIQQICATMEHSYLGDLQLKIIAPSGQSVILKQQNGGGSCDLGEPIATSPVDGSASSTLTDPGVGYQYCWNSNPTYLTMVGESGNFTRNYTDAQGHNYTDNYLPAGSYQPSGSLSNLLGATMNGNWTLEVKDQYSLDNGYIFEWNVSLVGGFPDTMVTLYEPDSIQMNGIITQAQCGGSNGAINLIVNGDFSPFTFLWSNGAITEDVSNLPSGTYSVVVTDSAGCIDSTSFNLNNISSLNITKTITKVTCAGGNNGAINVTPSGGTLPYTFSWSNGPTTEDLSGLTAGTYTLTITDGTGCKFSQSILVETLAPILISLDTKTNEFCGQANGAISVNVSGGSGSFGYSWSNGSSSEDIINIINGTYTITVTDANGCIASKSFSIINDVSNCSAYCYLTIQSIVTNENCGDGTGAVNITVNNPTQPYLVSWNTGQTIEDISSLDAGIYTVTVTDANQCVKVANVVVGNNTGNLSISQVQKSNENCGNTDGAIDITVAGGTLPYTYSWNNGATTQDINSLTAGIYSVNISDGNGCSFNASYTITNNTGNLASTALVYNEICGNNAGAINLTATGNAGVLSYLWSNGSTSQDISGLSAGLYSCTITDVNSCVLITPSYNVINSSSTLLLINNSVTNENCNNGLGAINLTLQGGTAPLIYSWSNGSATEDITGLSAGTYSAVITDNNGCSVQTGAINVFNTSGNLSITTDFVTNEICANNAGAIYVVTNGGTAPITYSWSNGSNSEDIINISAGTYTLTATDFNGCSYNFNETIINTSGTLQLVNAVVTNETCNNGTGAINVFVSGGNNPITYAWNTGAITQDLTLLSAGSYSITATDNNGCQVMGAYNIINNTGTLAVTSQGTAENCSNNGGAVNITVTGGTLPYSYLWNTGATTEDLTGISGGTYSCTITDGAACKVLTGNIIINNNPGNLVVTNVTTDESCGNSLGTITLNVSGGTLPYNYVWNPVVGAGASATNLSAGTYIYTVTDINGCTKKDSAEIINTTGTLTLNNVVVTNESCGNGLGAINLSVSGGAAPVTFLWNTTAITEDLVNLSQAQYSCVITDNSGCIINTGNIIVANNAGTLTIDNVQVTNESCGNTLGKINITISGGTLPYSYLWNTGSTTEDLTNLSDGNYTCTVTSTGGCSLQVHATVLNNSGSLYTTSNVVTNETCSSGNGAINLNPQGGSTPYTFIWSNGAITEDISNLVSGTYTVTINDAAGCSHIKSLTVLNTGASILISSTTLTNEICGNSSGGVDISIQGGTSPYTFNWNNGSASEDLTNVVAGNYSVNISDLNGCSTNGAFTINENTGSLAIDNFMITNEICGDGVGAIDLTIGSTTNPCCSYTLDMKDSFGDGWDGASLNVKINGTLYGNFTVPSGNNTVVPIPICNGDLLQLTYIAGTWEQEHSYTLKNSTGNIVYTATGPPVVGLVYTANAVCVSSAPNMTYLWSNGATTQDLININSGAYSVTITDVNGCSIDTSGVVQNITGGFAANIVATINENCGDTTGAINISVIGGSLPYSFVWSNGANTEDLSNLSAGSYNVTVIDASGCSVILSDVVNNNSGSLIISNAVTNDENCGDGTGYVDLTVNGLATPFTYSWSNGATSQDLSGLSAGTYSVTITDNTGCKLSNNFIISNNIGGLAASVIMNDEICGNSGGNITVTASGGLSPYVFNWTGGTPSNCCDYTLNMMDLGNSWNGASINVMVSGSSVGTFTVFSGGASTGTFNVCAGEPIALIWNSGGFDNEASFTLINASGNIIFTHNSGTGPIPGTIFNTTGACPMGPNNPSSLFNIPAGTYTATVTDDIGCVLTNTIVIDNIMALVTNGLSADASCLACANGSVNVTSVGDAPYSYSWSNGATTEDLINVLPGNYYVIISSSSGCQDSLYFTVNYPVDINELNNNWSVNVFPNPIRDEFTLEYNFKENMEVNFIVSNILGEIVHKQLIINIKGELKVDARNMKPGIYFMQLTGNNKIQTIKLIIAR